MKYDSKTVISYSYEYNTPQILEWWKKNKLIDGLDEIDKNKF